MRVLVIGEDESIHKTIVGLIMTPGVRVYAAHDQWEGLDLLGDVRPDLILCDLQPRFDRLRFVNWLRQRSPYSRTLTAAVTDGSQLGDRASGEAGFDEFLVKPITREMLGQLLERVLTGRRSARAATRLSFASNEEVS